MLCFLNSFLAFSLSFEKITFNPIIKYFGIIVNTLYNPIKKCIKIDIMILGKETNPVIKYFNIFIITPPYSYNNYSINLKKMIYRLLKK